MGFFLDEASGQLRGGWILTLFVVFASGAYGAGSLLIAVLGLYPAARLSLDDGYLFFTTMVMLGAACVATLICALVFGADAGLPRGRAGRDLLAGFALSAALISLAVAIPALAGKGSLWLSSRGPVGLSLTGLKQLLILAPTSIGEELLLRGVPLRLLAGWMRPWLAVALTGAVFGFMHLLNPSASWIAALNVALVGCWFGVLALRTSLWTAIAAHVTWNWFEGFVFGQPVSGISPAGSLFEATVGTQGFFSGGEFGPEAAGMTTVLLALATVGAVVWPRSPVQKS